jgi:hypothetical protein
LRQRIFGRVLEGTAGAAEMHFGGSYRRVRSGIVELFYLLRKVWGICRRVLLRGRTFGCTTGAFFFWAGSFPWGINRKS